LSVGRTYVTTGRNAWERRYRNGESDYLLEKVTCGEGGFLFVSRTDAEAYIEKCDLALWLGCISVMKANKYSIEQLRKVKEILEK